MLECLVNAWSGMRLTALQWGILFGCLLAGICAALWFIGVVPTFIFGHDIFFFLEEGWRAQHGLRPHLDYWTGWGPVISVAMGFGLRMAHNSPNAIGYVNAIVAGMVGLWSYGLGANRLTAPARILFALYASLLATSPYSLGESPFLSSHAMLYNRYGYALMTLMLLECVMPLEGAAEGYLGGASTGAAVALALFLKASYFAVSLPLLFASFVFGGIQRKRLAGLALGFSLIALLFMAYLRFDFAKVFTSLAAVGAARTAHVSLKQPLWIVESQVPTLGLALALGIGASFLPWGLPPRGGRSRVAAWQFPVMALLVYFADVILISSNAQPTGLPILPALALFVASRLSCGSAMSPEARRNSLPFAASLLTVCGALFVPQFASDTVGLAAGIVHKIDPPAQMCEARFDEPQLADLLLCDHPAVTQKSANGVIYTTTVNDGAALLHKNASEADRVLTMDMQNPFPYALGWAPPKGGVASMTFNYSLDAEHRPSFDEYFGNATIVMVPKQPAQTPDYLDGFNELFLPALKERYVLAAESEKWWMYRLK